MRKVAYAGLGTSLAGAALDFWSGYSLGSMVQGEAMDGVPPASSIGLYLLGIAVLITGILIVLPGSAANMRRLGLAMEVFGVVMVLASYLAPGMDLVLSYAMLFVGAAMILNGAAMQRSRKSMETG